MSFENFAEVQQLYTAIMESIDIKNTEHNSPFLYDKFGCTYNRSMVVLQEDYIYKLFRTIEQLIMLLHNEKIVISLDLDFYKYNNGVYVLKTDQENETDEDYINTINFYITIL